MSLSQSAPSAPPPWPPLATPVAARMAFTMLDLVAETGCAAKADLVRRGFSIADIENHGAAARREAEWLSSRRRLPALSLALDRYPQATQDDVVRLAADIVDLTRRQGAATEGRLLDRDWASAELDAFGPMARALAERELAADVRSPLPSIVAIDDGFAAVRAALSLAAGRLPPLTALAIAGAVGRAQGLVLATPFHRECLGLALGALRTARDEAVTLGTTAVLDALDELRLLLTGPSPLAAQTARAQADLVGARAQEAARA